MTRRRAQSTARRSLALVGCAAALLGACARRPDDAPVVENLDPETGVTVARLGRPLELYRETSQQDVERALRVPRPVRDQPDGQARVVPVARGAHRESGRIRHRQRDQWMAHALDARRRRDRAADFAGLRKSPYKIPTPWIAMYYLPASTRLRARSTCGIEASATTEISVDRRWRRPQNGTGCKTSPASTRRRRANKRLRCLQRRIGCPHDPSLATGETTSTRGMTTCVPGRRSDRSVSGLYWRSSQIGRLLKPLRHGPQRIAAPHDVDLGARDAVLHEEFTLQLGVIVAAQLFEGLARDA